MKGVIIVGFKLLMVQAQCALTAKVPGSQQLLLPGHRVIQGVDVGDEGHAGDVPCRDVLRGHHGQLPSLKHYSAVRSTGMVEQASHQVHPGTKVFRRGSSERKFSLFRALLHLLILPV